jgi:hypothetical protein
MSFLMPLVWIRYEKTSCTADVKCSLGEGSVGTVGFADVDADP